MKSFDFVTAATAEYLPAAKRLIQSIHRCDGRKIWGVLERPLGVGELHIPMLLSEIEGWNVRHHPIRYHLKMEHLKRAARESSADYLVWVDSDCQFFGRPDLERFVGYGRLLFACLEGDILAHKSHWWWSFDEWTALLKRMKYKHKRFFNLNGGFWGVWRTRIDEADALMRIIPPTDLGLSPTADEPHLAYAIQSMEPKESGLDELVIEKHLDVFLYTFQWPFTEKFVNWCTHEESPIPECPGIIHYVTRHGDIKE